LRSKVIVSVINVAKTLEITVLIARSVLNNLKVLGIVRDISG